MLIAVANHSQKMFAFSGVNKNFSLGLNIIEPFACQFLPSASIGTDGYHRHSKIVCLSICPSRMMLLL